MSTTPKYTLLENRSHRNNKNDPKGGMRKGYREFSSQVSSVVGAPRSSKHTCIKHLMSKINIYKIRPTCKKQGSLPIKPYFTTENKIT